MRGGSFELNIPTEGKSKIKNIKVMGEKNKVPIMPILTFNSEDGYKISSDSIYKSNYEPWKAFSQNNLIESDAWVSDNNVLPHWIQIKLPNLITISNYTITSRNNSDSRYIRPPKSWSLLGSKDGKNWTILDERINETTWNANETKVFNIKNNLKHYSFYKLNIIANYTSDNYVSIGNLQLYNANLDNLEKTTFNNKMTYMQHLDKGKLYEGRILIEYSNITNIDIR